MVCLVRPTGKWIGLPALHLRCSLSQACFIAPFKGPCPLCALLQGSRLQAVVLGKALRQMHIEAVV